MQLTRSLDFKAGSPLVVKATGIKTQKTDRADNPAGWEDMSGMKKLGVMEVDPMLTAHQDHLQYRFREYMKRKTEIEKVEGSLENFAKGEHFSSSQVYQVVRFSHDEVTC